MDTTAPTPWDSYALVFLSAGLSLLVPLALAALSRLLGGGRPAQGRAIERAPGPVALNQQTALGHRIHFRFFLAANCALILIGIALLLVSGVSGVGVGDPSRAGRNLAAVVTLTLFATLGLLYSAKKGDLSWILAIAPAKKGGK